MSVSFSSRAAGWMICLLLTGLPTRLTAEDSSPASAHEEPPVSDGDREHWSFRPLVRPAVPVVESKLRSRARNPVDAFIFDRLQKAGVEPAPEADRRTLIRRAAFVLTGLPPSIDDVRAFENDPAADAFERVIERLLDAPEYGERFAQHWLDLARFAETDGFEHDKVRGEAWRYRDWVIDAFNDDLPFDDFIQAQLAGDEMGNEWKVATGFLTSGPDMPDINNQDERRHSFLNDMAATVGSVFMGLQVGCAQCHDHKTDPVSQHDFYRLRAFFDRSFEFARDKPARMPAGQPLAPASWLMIRGDFSRKGPPLSPQYLRIVALSSAPPVPGNGRGLRSALADWLTRPDHPLTTRVLASRLWQFHFGQGLTETPSDFGLSGDSPLHEELLDWLATEIPRRGWSLKAMHRLLMTSTTWQLASHLPLDANDTERRNWNEARARDSRFRLHSRGLRRRLEGEVIRDTLLAVSGQLSQRRNGPGIRPPLPPELTATLLRDQWPVSPDRADDTRRSIYLFVRRNLRFPILEAFDRPDPSLSCPRRHVSTIAPQALTLLNSDFSAEAARALARLIERDAGSSPDRQVTALYERTLQRAPTAEEQDAAREFLEQSPAGLPDLCLAVLNLNEMIYLD